MPTNFVKGDVLEEAANGEGKRALAFAAESGISVAVKKRWPAFERVDRLEPGHVFEWHEGDLWVFALGIQRGWNARPKMSWVERALGAVVERAKSEGVARILLPRLGGDWTRAKKVLSEIGAKTTIDLVVFEQFIRGAVRVEAPAVEAPKKKKKAPAKKKPKKSTRAKKKSASKPKKKKAAT